MQQPCELLASSDRRLGKGGAVKILAVEDEPGAARHLERLCSAILTDKLERFAVADSLTAAAARLGETAFDVVLLDPQLQRGNGLQLLSVRSMRPFQTIVVSARTDLALNAFEYGVLDFV